MQIPVYQGRNREYSSALYTDLRRASKHTADFQGCDLGNTSSDNREINRADQAMKQRHQRQTVLIKNHLIPAG